MSKFRKANLLEKLRAFDDLWQPKIIAELNDYQFKLVKVKDKFVWHRHQETDEAFLVLKGELVIEFEDTQAEVKEGELLVVPKGVLHRPYAQELCHLLIIEPQGVLNIGDASDVPIAPNDAWV